MLVFKAEGLKDVQHARHTNAGILPPFKMLVDSPALRLCWRVKKFLTLAKRSLLASPCGSFARLSPCLNGVICSVFFEDVYDVRAMSQTSVLSHLGAMGPVSG